MKLVYFSILIFAFSISAHKALLLVEDNEDGTIYIEAGISTGGNAAGNMILITEVASGKPIWQGPVPDSGNFEVERPNVPYVVTLDMGAGHKVSKRGPLIRGEVGNSSIDSVVDINGAAKNIDNTSGKVIAVLLPPIEKIIDPLVKNTDIRVINIMGDQASVMEIDDFVKNNYEYVSKKSQLIDAVAGIRSLWPEEKLFNYLRRFNIRVIEIDLASPLDPQTSGVAIKYHGDKPNYNVWLNFTNVSKMMEIAATDLSNLFPSDSIKIKENLKSIKKELFAEKAKYENLFSSLEFVDVAVIGEVFDYILNEAGVYVSAIVDETISKRDEKEYNDLTNFFASSKKDILIHKWKPIDKKLEEIITSQKVSLVLLDDGLNPMDKRSIVQIVENNYQKLYDALVK